MLPRRTFLALSIALCAAASQSCSSDWSDDQSFAWGYMQASQSGGFSDGWIGDGMDGWQDVSGASQSSYPNGFNEPFDACVTNNGYIYVADSQNHRVCRWDLSGKSRGWIGGGSPGWQYGIGPVSSGNDLHYFYEPSGVAVDCDGNIYVADKKNNRISRWTGSGGFDGWIGGGEPGWQWSQAPPSGNSQAHFLWPVGIWIEGTTIYIADSNNHRIAKWDLDANPLGWIGGGSDGWRSDSGASSAADPRSFNLPMDVSVSPAGDLYVADMMNNRISRWSVSSGTATGWTGGGSDSWQMTTWSAAATSEFRYLNSPAGIAFAGDAGMLLVSDSSNNRIYSYDVSGKATGWIGGGKDGWQTDYGAPSTQVKSGFWSPMGLCVFRNGRIYAADRSNHRVSRWSTVPMSVTDTLPPGPVGNLQATPIISGEVALGWTASGDDGMTWQASGYIIRYSYSAISSDADFDAAQEHANNIHPNAPGFLEGISIYGLNSGQQCWFAIKVTDEFFNLSQMVVTGPVMVP